RREEVAVRSAGNGLGEGDGELHAGGVRRGAGDAHDGGDGRRGLVDGVDVSGGEVAVAGPRAAERNGRAAHDGVVVDDVEANRAVAAAGIDGDGARRAAAGDA